MTVTELNPGRSHQQRWRPTRAGIVNIWRYYGETFEFHQGRLLLRGPNGTGKSKALELLLPYLFDASLRPHRLSTFGSGDRTMHWNLMGEGNTGSTRVGYVWLEFGRVIDGEQAWFGCGARLQATANTKNVTSTYFTTTRRIGLPGGVRLVNDAGRPLIKNDLVAEIGDDGEVYGSPAEYRRAVRQTLFPGVSEQRYDALITALLQLRTPKLSERLDPSVLSTLLSKALPPLDHADIAEIAEGFERLDRQREELKILDGEVAEAEKLATRQKTYAQRVLRFTAAGLITATSKMSDVTRKARESREEHIRAQAELTTVTERDRTLAAEKSRTDTRIEGIVDSPAYREGSQLPQLRQAVAAAERHAAEAARHAAKLREQATRDAKRAAELAREEQTAEQETDRRSGEAWQAAERAGMPAVFEEIARSADTASGRRLLRAAVDSKAEQVAQVRRAAGAHREAVERRSNAERWVEAARERLAAAESGAGAARQARERRFGELAAELVRWAQACRQLVVGDPERLAELVTDRAAVLEVVRAAETVVLERCSIAEAELRATRDGLFAEIAGHEAERDELERRVDRPPPAPRTRGMDRASADGAPLWRLLEFQADVPDEVRTAVEAGLEAAGLLDAWVLPKGTLSAPGRDTFAETLFSVSAPGRSLADLLVVDENSPVSTDRVRRLLAGIAFGDTAPNHPAAIGGDGTWRLASVHGRWHKPEAEFIGAAVRERARRRRIVELDELIEVLKNGIDDVDDRLGSIAQQREALAAELAQRPGFDGVDAAEDELTKAELLCATRADAVSAAEQDRQSRENEVATAWRELTSEAATHGLPTGEDKLDDVDAAVRNLRGAADLWLDSRTESRTAAEKARDAGNRADESSGNAAAAQETADERGQEAENAAIKLRTVEESVGTEFRRLDEDLAALRKQSAEFAEEQKQLRGAERRLVERIGTLAERQREDESRMADATEARDDAEERFRERVAGSLPEDARVELDPGPLNGKRSTLDAARKLAEQLSGVLHEPKNVRDAEGRLAQAVHDAQPLLAGRADLDLEQGEEVSQFTATVDGVRHGAVALLKLLRVDRERTAEQITADERKLFDQTLTGDTRRHIAERIRAANELVDTMNHRLERVRTASNVRVRLVWQVDPQLPAGTREARELLLRNPATLAEPERDALHRFFRERVDEARSADTAIGWEQQLLQVLDYTAWHQFVVKVDRGRGEGWQPVTKRLHGALSGGEKAIVLHLPLFAAAAAHYQSTPLAPRLILLDEVFVGVDSTNRGQLLELLVSFDLDLVLTSDHEWCDYRELTGIAIHQLVTGTDDDAVTTVRFTWDGRELRAAEEPLDA
ncbi:TIGR02680 family protein [Saccharopolyspora shandongensis]|uniref:TIGR02680 family protein n=1 Tax=Saccharopolyspora shandongensis TaxID=418495 RepID=UPI0033F1DBF9